MSDKIKTLSQAIRLGATFRPQCCNAFFQEGKSCALGAAYEALTGVYDAEADEAAISGFLYRRCRTEFGKLAEIAEMNDSRGFSREAIAGWLEAQGL